MYYDEKFPSVPTDTEVGAFIRANPKYATWRRSLVIELMMSLASDHLNPTLAARLDNEQREAYRIEHGAR